MQTNISYEIKKSRRARAIRISVHHDGRVVITQPVFVPQHVVARFIHEKIGWIQKRLEIFKKFQYLPTVKKNNRAQYAKTKSEALALVAERLKHSNQFYNFPYNRIFIKNQKTRWGSCSAKKNLSFNYKILFLPKELQDYIIVHELCHLGEMNHSKSFWSLVSRTIPSAKPLRSQLRKFRI